MSARGWSAALGLAAACTSANPAYEATGEETVGQDETTGMSASSSDTTDPGPTSSTNGMVDGSSETQGSEEGPVQQETCNADLYAINDEGTLYLLDVDAGTAIAMLHGAPELASWAIATHPETGLIYISQYDAPDTVWLVSPVVFSRDPTPVLVPSANTAPIARAAFSPGNQLWLGTDDTSLFIELEPAAGVGNELYKNGMGRGGDLLFLDGNTALLPALDGNVWLVELELPDAPTGFPIMLEGMPWTQQFTGVARDREGRPWASTVEGLLVRLEIDGLPAMPPTAAEVIDFGLVINDLAPIVVLPGGC